MTVFKEVPRYKFVAASDNVPAALDKVVAEHGVKGFADGMELIKSGLCDAILIATPHYFHPVYAVAGLDAGLHVLTEKPVAVTVKAADEMNQAAARNPKQKFGVMFQMRTTPMWRKMRELITTGQIGEIRRVQWTATAWFRTQAYYNSGTWRATWEGEGGGVLLNQCPHNLDLLYWLTGQPKRITANIALGKYHQIEVEDDVTAFLEYANGATGVFIASTGEHPGSGHFEIMGDRGRLSILPDGKIEFVRTEVPVDQFCRTTKVAWSTPQTERIVIETPSGGSHKNIHENFAAAICDGVPLIAPAVEGVNSLEMANGMIMSGLTGKPVDLPLDRGAYEKLLAKLIKEAKARKKKA